MADASLAALTARAAKALQHPALVQLARSNSPSKTYRLAQQGGWPNRQADGARALAQMRRDYTTEFESLISVTSERVLIRTQVRDNRRQRMNPLDRIKGPLGRLRYMLRLDMHDEVKVELERLVANLIPYFWYEGHCERMNKCVLQATSDSKEHPLGVVYLAFHAAETDLSSDCLNINDCIVNVHWPTLVSTLGWSDDEARAFAGTVLERLVNGEVRHHFYMWIPTAMQLVCRTLMQHEDELAIRTERWLILWHFRHGRLFELRRSCLPDNEIHQRDRDQVEGQDYEQHEELNPIVDRMISLGMTEEEVRVEFLSWIEKHARNCRPQFMLAVAGAKCFKEGDADRSQLIRTGYLRGFWKDMVSSGHPESGNFYWKMFGQLARFGMWEHRTRLSWKDPTPVDNDRDFFHDQLVDLLSRGRARFVYDFIMSWGYPLGLRDDSSARACGNYDRKEALAGIEALAYQAFVRAFDAERYGVAAALGQRFCVFDEEQINSKSLDAVRSRAEELVDVTDNDDVYCLITEGVHEEEGECCADPCDDAHLELHRKLLALGEEWKAEHAELVEAAKKQPVDAIELAVNLEQPIRLEFAY